MLVTYGDTLTAGRPGSGTDLGSEVTVGRSEVLRLCTRRSRAWEVLGQHHPADSTAFPPLPGLPARATAATQQSGEQGKDAQEATPPPPVLSFQQENTQNSLSTDFL